MFEQTPTITLKNETIIFNISAAGPSLRGGTLALCQGPRTRKGPHTTAVVAAADHRSVDQSNQIASP